MARATRGRRGRPAPAPGLVLLPVLGVALALALLLVAGWNAAAARRAEQQVAQRREQAQVLMRQDLVDWYRGHLGQLDVPGGLPPDPATALAGRPEARGLTVLVGELQFDGEVAGRPLRVLGPGSRPVTAGAPPLVDGRSLERAALATARAQLARTASRLEQWFRARIAVDPLHRRDRNYFRPADPACLALPGELPCLPEYAELAALPFLRESLALSPDSVRTPWGACCPIEASNGVDASADPPYSLALRIRTPWNTQLQARAVQPGGSS